MAGPLAAPIKQLPEIHPLSQRFVFQAVSYSSGAADHICTNVCKLLNMMAKWRVAG
jgi:hypothetical protein